MSKSNQNQKQIYLPDGYDEKLLAVAQKLERDGYDVRDPKRGTLSISAAIRVLVDEKLGQVVKK